jgi:thymidylate kinase
VGYLSGTGTEGWTVTAVHAAVAPKADDPAAPLALLLELVKRLTQQGVRYCHWKSNEHLAAALTGDTDLDLLVDHAAATSTIAVLGELGFKRFNAPAEISYVGVEDYLGLDYATGKLAHVHLHYRLVMGEKYLKGYRLPWEELLLSTRQVDPESGTYVTDPNLELVLLVVRAAVKLRRRDRLRAGRRSRYVAGDLHREFTWLVERTHPERVQILARDLLGHHAAIVLRRLVEAGLTVEQLLELRGAAAPVLDRFRTYHRVTGNVERWRREWRERSRRALRRFFGVRVALGFSLPRGGVIIAFVGADGSGKSTVVRATASWLSWRVQVLPVYLGFGDGKISLLRRLLQSVARVGSKSLAGSTTDASLPKPRTSHVRPMTSRAKAIWRVLWAWSIVREKRVRLRQAIQARNLGHTVICDRYPQAQIGELSDGPLLSRFAENRTGWFRAAAGWELEAYREMEGTVPDLVIKLHVAPEVSARRKLDVSLDSLRQRVDTVRQLRFAKSARVLEVDSNQPLDDVLLQVKRAVWEAL